MANCSNRCPVFQEIEGLRAKCLACKVCEDGNTMQVGGSGVVSLDSAESPELVLRHSIGRKEHNPSVGREERESIRNVTALDAETEDTLRSVVCTYFGLRPIEVLLCHHLANGGNLSSFGRYIESVRADMGKYKHLDKRNAWSMFKRIGKVFGPFRTLAGGLIGRGKGGAIKQAVRKQLNQMDLDF